MVHGYSDFREHLESRSPNLGPYTTKGYFIGTPPPLRDLLVGSSRGSGDACTIVDKSQVELFLLWLLFIFTIIVLIITITFTTPVTFVVFSYYNKHY